MRRQTASEKETFILAKKLAQTLRGGEVIALYGNLGAGKTVFAKGVAAGLGIKTAITSPTFTLMNVYPVKHRGRIKQFVHVDCYRLTSVKQLVAIGLLEYLNNPNTIVLIEWAERAQTLLTKKAHTVSLVVVKNNRRTITITTHA